MLSSISYLVKLCLKSITSHSESFWKKEFGWKIGGYPISHYSLILTFNDSKCFYKCFDLSGGQKKIFLQKCPNILKKIHWLGGQTQCNKCYIFFKASLMSFSLYLNIFRFFFIQIKFMRILNHRWLYHDWHKRKPKFSISKEYKYESSQIELLKLYIFKEHLSICIYLCLKKRKFKFDFTVNFHIHCSCYENIEDNSAKC